MILVRFFEYACRALVSLAPPAHRRQWGDEVVATVRSACVDADRHRGSSGVMAQGLLELADVARSVVRLRLGRVLRVTGGLPPSNRPGRGRHTGGAMMRTLAHDVRLAVRSLLGSRTHTAIAVVTLALGIGINSAVFSILDSILLRPLPFKDAGRLVILSSYNVAGHFTFEGMKSSLMLEWRKQTDLFDRVESFERSSFVFADPSGSEMVAGSSISPGLLSMLGVAPKAGRLFTEEDGRSGTDHLVIVSERFRRSHLHGDVAAVGRAITLDGQAYTIVGILPEWFRFPDELHDVWLPWNADAPPPPGSSPQRTSLHPQVVPLARVKQGVLLSQAFEQVIARGAAINRASGGDGKESAKAYQPGSLVNDNTKTSLIVLGGAVSFLLLIVCANLANLALSRAMPRARDLAVRAALGASRADLVRETLAENLTIGLLGAIAGLGVAALGIKAALAVMPSDMVTASYNPVALDGRVLGVTIVIGLATALLFGLPPALVASRASVTDVLRRDSRSSTGSALSRRLRSALVVAEVSLSIVLLVGAALMTRSFVKLQAVDKGLDPTGLIAMRVSLPKAGYEDAATRDRFVADAMDRIRKVPGVIGVTTGAVPPEMDAVRIGQIEFAQKPGDKTPMQFMPAYEVPPNFFATLGITLTNGHTFGEGDPEGAVIISENFAHKYWPAGQAIGGHFRWANDEAWLTVIGVAATVRQGALADSGRKDAAQMYIPIGQGAKLARPVGPSSTIADSRTIVVRAVNPAAVIAALPQAVHDVDPHVVIGKRSLVEHLFADAIARPRIVFLMMSVFAIFGLVLAAAGIYGVLSCLVSQRLREIGIRLALGASPRQVGRLILQNGMGLTMAGLAAGIGMALMLVRVMRTLLYEVEPSDPVSVAIVAGVLLATAFLASWRPARRAMRVDPVSLLRED
jgi:putative ABC transport system permease protein